MVRPLIVHEVAVVVVQLWPPTEAVAVYPVMGLPPVLVGAVHEIVAWAFPGVAVKLAGGCGGKIIRETVPAPLFVTHTLDPSGLTTTPKGLLPTVIEVTAVVEGVIALASRGNVITLRMANAVAITANIARTVLRTI